MFEYFGADRVRILNGGLKKWLLEGRPIASGPSAIGDTSYKN